MTHPQMAHPRTTETPIPLLHDALTCPHCGCDDIRQYADERPICPHCGAVRVDAPADLGWLAQWPPRRRSTLANHFYQAARSGLSAPPQIVDHVMAAIQRKLMWKTDFEERQFWCEVFNTIADDPQAAQAYAGEVLAVEQLPAAAKAARKVEKSKAYVLEAMRGREATPKQHGLLRALGHAGELPADRAVASELIDALLRKGRL
jgi:hypothetical protein